MTQAIVKKFFTDNPRVIIASHWRENEMTARFREGMPVPRIATVRSRAIAFKHATGISELTLKGIAGRVAGDELHVSYEENPNGAIVYKAAP